MFFFLNSSSNNALTCSTVRVRCTSCSRSPDIQSMADMGLCLSHRLKLKHNSVTVIISTYIRHLLTSLSSWITITSLNTPWAAGCWGPKLSWNDNDKLLRLGRKRRKMNGSSKYSVLLMCFCCAPVAINLLLKFLTSVNISQRLRLWRPS